MNKRAMACLTLFMTLGLVALLQAQESALAPSAGVQARIDRDLVAGRSLVVHVVVALCDNQHQGIVPVQPSLGNGQDPRNNLYWGAMYGVRTFLTRSAGWRLVESKANPRPGILERIILVSEIVRNGSRRRVFLVADAWDGRETRRATRTFLDMAAGAAAETVRVQLDGGSSVILAGGLAPVVCWVGHNGLMDHELAVEVPDHRDLSPRSAMVLACASRSYFARHLRAAGAHPLLLTTQLMAPEAYTLDAVLQQWLAGHDAATARSAAVAAYARYQKVSQRAVDSMFWTGP